MIRNHHICAAPGDPTARRTPHYAHPTSRESRVVTIATDTEALSGAARWMAERVPDKVWGTRIEYNERRVIAYDGRTQTQARTAERGPTYAEEVHKAYGDGNNPVCCDWLFPAGKIGETGAEYWRRAVVDMISRGVVAVSIGAERLDLIDL